MSEKSSGYVKFLNEIKKEKRNTSLARFFILFFFCIAWELASRFGLINTFITSSPVNIIKTVISMCMDKTLFYHAGITLSEVLIGFAAGMLLGVVFSVALWSYPKISAVLDPYIVVLNALPKVALGPLIIIWAGAGMKSIIIMTLAISLITTVISVYGGFSQTDTEKIRLLKSFGAKKPMILTKLIFPANVVNLANSLKINIGLSWVGAIMGEFLVSKAGIGYLIMYGSQVFNLNLVMSGVIILAACAAFTYYGVVFIEKLMCKRYE